MHRSAAVLLAWVLLIPVLSMAQDPADVEPPAEATAGANPTSETPGKKTVTGGKEAPDVVKLQQEVYWAPPGAGNDQWTWIMLKSGEWQRGEIKDLHRGTLRFDSDELNEFNYDWDNVRSVISGRPHTITTWEPAEVHTGFIVARRGSISVLDDEGAVIAIVDPGNVSSMIQGLPQERNYWGGSFSLGTTLRVGNSDQSDASIAIEIDRHAMFTRWENSANSSYGSSGGDKTQETHRFTSSFDWFRSRQWFITLAGYEYYRDPFQNIEQRHIPGAGGGYTRDWVKADWDFTALLAWQGIKYVSVQPGESLTQDSVTWRLGTSLDWEVTGDVDFDLDFSINYPFGRIEAYSSNLVSTLSVDLFLNLDVDLTFEWDRQNKPRQDENGNLPEKDDFRLATGVSWEF